jgi:hypothetical protein
MGFSYPEALELPEGEAMAYLEDLKVAVNGEDKKPKIYKVRRDDNKKPSPRQR